VCVSMLAHRATDTWRDSATNALKPSVPIFTRQPWEPTDMHVAVPLWPFAGIVETVASPSVQSSRALMACAHDLEIAVMCACCTSSAWSRSNGQLAQAESQVYNMLQTPLASLHF
jgi:hypothetical protein